MKRTAILLLPLFALLFQDAPCQRLGVAYYDLDGLYDTIPSPFYDDEAYTPRGRLHWNTTRYRRAVENLASVIDSMGMPLTGIGSVENEWVMRDLAAACRLDYSYLHRTLNTLDGLDMGLLYYGDRFYPDRTETGSGWLRVDGELDGRETTIILCSPRARFVEEELASLREREPGRRLIVLGGIPGIRPRNYGLTDALSEAARRGFGNVRRRSGWQMADRILTDTAYHIAGGSVYARRRLFDPKTGYPLPLFEKTRYRDGFSRRLPIFTYLFPISDE